MKPLIILGDVHGNINHCVNLANNNPSKTVLQLGDLGAGFVPTEFLQSALPNNFVFFAGNHDNRLEAARLSHYLGDYGEFNGVFFVSGAHSYDKASRQIGIDWWPDEELSHQQGNEVLDQWQRSKCQIIVSHDCPSFVAERWWNIKDGTFTRKLLSEMFIIKKPKLWVFGHHHKAKKETIIGTDFVCLGIDRTFEILA